MSTQNLTQFIQEVYDNSELREQLSAATDQTSFVNLAVTLGEDHGYSFTHDEVIAVLVLKERSQPISFPLPDTFLARPW